MITAPRRAPVRPHITTPDSGEPIALEHKVQAVLSAGSSGLVYLRGPAGSGKTTALQHLAATLPADSNVLYADGLKALEATPARADALVLCATTTPPPNQPAPTWTLCPWTDDDFIEYLLAVHHDRCADIMARMPDRGWLGGIPQLCAIVIDELAQDASLRTARLALHSYLHRMCEAPRLLDRARAICLETLTEGGQSVFLPASNLHSSLPSDLRLVLRHAQTQRILAAEAIVADLQAERRCDYLAVRLPRELVNDVAEHLADSPGALSYLEGLLAGNSWSHAMAASLLHAARPGWIPQVDQRYELTGAYMGNAAWAGRDLSRIQSLREADLSHADLTESALDGVSARRANLRHAHFTRALLKNFHALDADLTGADLAHASAQNTHWDGATLAHATLTDALLSESSFRGCNLTAARFGRAVLSRCNFVGATLTDADFRGALLHLADLSKLRLRDADFRDARLPQANLSRCDMEAMELPGVDLRQANLSRSLLTGANLAGANLGEANLRGAALGEINLEHADLRGADLTHATFHMGSSRSGLVDSPIASEGSRTGFYTDDADDQGFKSPEEIRKANLCFADLRGAFVLDADFYLVDLRGAIYDDAQREHFRRCRAILD